MKLPKYDKSRKSDFDHFARIGSQKSVPVPELPLQPGYVFSRPAVKDQIDLMKRCVMHDARNVQCRVNIPHSGEWPVFRIFGLFFGPAIADVFKLWRRQDEREIVIPRPFSANYDLLHRPVKEHVIFCRRQHGADAI